MHGVFNNPLKNYKSVNVKILNGHKDELLFKKIRNFTKKTKFKGAVEILPFSIYTSLVRVRLLKIK